MEAAAAMDFHALSRRELQALCKRNGVRANMTNAAMAEALQGLTSVDGINEIGTTLCLPTPGRSAMKSAAKMAEMAGEEQQHGSPLPRGRRVSVKSPEAIRMEVEEGEDEMKRDLVKEIVKTPGVALRSTSRRARATPAPLPTPVPASSARATARRAAAPARKMEEVTPTPATLRRSQRTAARKGVGPVEVDQSAEDVSAAKRTTRSTRSKVTMALDQEDKVAAAASKEEVLQEEPKAVASDVKCDDPEEEEVTKVLDGDNKEEKPEEGDEADSSHAAIWSAGVSDKNCDDPILEEVAAVLEKEEQTTKPNEEIVEEEEEPISVEKSAPLTIMEDSPILGVLSKVETAVPAIEKEQGASVEDGEDLAREMTDESIPVSIEKEVAVNEEAVKEDGFAVTGETDPTPEEILPAAVEDEASEEDSLTEVKEGTAYKMHAELVDDETSEEDEEDGFTEVKEGGVHEMPRDGQVDYETDEEDEDDGFPGVKDGAAHEVPQAELADDDETSDDDPTELKEGAAVNMPQSGQREDEISEEDDLDGDEEWESDDDSSEENGSCDESDEETDETYDKSYRDVAKATVIAVENDEDASTEDDDFSGDLPPELFDNIVIYSDDETESDIAPPVLEENQAAVKSLDDSAMNAKAEQQEKILEESDATEKAMKEVDNIVKSLDEFTFKEGEAKEMQKKLQVEDYNTAMSLRKLKSAYKNCLIALKETKEEVTEGKRLPLEEVDENACGNC